MKAHLGLNMLLAPLLLASAGPTAALAGGGSLTSPRETSADALRSALDRDRDAARAGAPAEERLAPLLAGARAAHVLLGERWTAARLDALVEEARWRGFIDAEQATAWLAGELAAEESDLRFEPLMEADIPVGFPAPTPVGEIELKQFPVYRLARTGAGPRSGGAFWKLFMHIERSDISMTAPVEMTYAEDGERLREDQMAFLYGSTELGELGRDGSVEVLDAEAGWAVSLGCRGNTTRSTIQAARAELEAWLATRPELTVAGELRVMGYNSPMVRSSKRYFEVQLPVTNEPSPLLPIVIDFSEPGAARDWSPINDSVMGGVSASRFQSTADGTAVFSGRLSLENNGGFCSVRTAPADWAVADAQELVLRVRGDGQRYKLRLRTDDRWDGVSYELPFETEAGVWTEVALPVSDFVPVWRGRLVRDAPALDPARIRTFGLMISDKQVGEFRLELESLAKRTVTP